MAGRIHLSGNLPHLIVRKNGNTTLQKKDWNPNKPLTRSDLDLVPFYVKNDGELDQELQ